MYHSQKTLKTRVPYVVWLQWKNPLFKDTTTKSFQHQKNHYTEQFDLKITPLLEVALHDTYFVDPSTWLWHLLGWRLTSAEQFKIRTDHNKQNDQIERNYVNKDSYVTDAIRCALFNFWTVNPKLPDALPPLPRSPPRPKFKKSSSQVSMTKIFLSSRKYWLLPHY